MTIDESITAFLEDLAGARRSANTIRSYKNGLTNFRLMLRDEGLKPETETTEQLTEQHVRDFLSGLGAEHAKATINLYLAAVRAYVEFLDEQEWVPQINTSRLAKQLRKRMPRSGRRLPQFPREEIEKVLAYAESLTTASPADDEHAYLANLRDRAFILMLADTGLRVHEACALKRKDVDWNEGRAVIIGKGDKEAAVRFSTRALEATKHYLNERSKLDQSSGRQIATLPIFTGHGRSNMKKDAQGGVHRFKHMTTETGRAIVRQRVQECLGAEMVGQITPHSFRHYFVTIVLHATGGNIRIAQELARHSNISTTQRYTHLVSGELDEAYHETFNQKT